MTARQRRAAGPPALALLLATAVAASAAPGRTAASPPAGEAASAPPAASPAADRPPPFEDVAAASGLDFVHRNGMSGQYYFPEMTGGGGALFDYDGDGDLDVFLVQGHPLGPAGEDDGAAPAAGGPPQGGRLYRNDLAPGPDGRPVPRFTDVTAASGLDSRGYGMGVAAADVDNDGWTDLYVANFGRNELWRNRGDGIFEEIAAAAGVEDRGWSVGASFLDFDRDGWLDLYVVDYVDFSIATHKVCPTVAGEPDYCGPLAYPPLQDRLFRNRGGGRFEDVTAKALRGAAPATGLGAVAGDFDGDGWIDLYVANDLMPNNLWINQRDGTFADDAVLAGCAVNGEGQLEASMGVDAGDFDDDGDEDLFMTHLTGQTNTLYVNGGGGQFHDATRASGLGPPSWPMTGFGTVFFDYDGDGRLDLATVNGAVKTLEPLARAGDPYPLHQTNQLFRNRGAGATPPFEEVTDAAGEAFSLSEVSRGLAVGDVDGDGDPDLLVVNNNGPVRLLLDRAADGVPWIGLRLLDGHGRDALGARVELARRGAPTLTRRVRTDGSYASAHDPRVLFGLGGGGEATGVRVVWPSGSVERFPAPAPGAYTTLREGTGTPEPAAADAPREPS